MPLLRSWLKEEQLASRNSMWGATLRLAALLVTAVVGLEAWRRVENSQAQVRQQQTTQLELLQWIVGDTTRPLRDWAHWDDTYNYITGTDPEFVIRDMDTTGLLDGGAVLAIIDGQNLLQNISGAETRDRDVDSPLVRCFTGVAAMQSLQPTDSLPLVCPSARGPLVGGIATITDTPIRRRTAARLAYVVPLLQNGSGSTVQKGLNALSRNLVFPGGSTAAAVARADGITLVNPTLWTGNGQRLAVRLPDAGPTITRELLALAGLVTGGLAITIGLRAQWMLNQRRQRLRQIRLERLGNQRIRRTERELNALLDQVQVGGEANEDQAFARLLHRQSLIPHGDAPVARNERLARRFEQVLQTARSLALLDTITTLPNRSYFLERLNLESERSRQSGKPLALLFINIDKFKQINEAYGHNTGDAVLRHVAQELQELTEAGDFLARFGGDEFSLILNTDTLGDSSEAAMRDHAHQRALELLERFQSSARQQPEQIKLSLSVGVAISDATGTTPEELIRRSDMAMVMAKTRRQERVSVFDIDSDWDALNNYRLFNALQSDISHAPERFSVLFQPIVDSTGAFRKVEALSRWANPEFPDVPADVVFALAERYRLVEELGRLILDRTFQELVQLRQELGQPELGLAINISPSQLAQEGFGTWLLAQLSLHRIRPESVTVEITELAVVETGFELTDNLAALRRAGVQLALDDFGTGYSSLRLLMWLKPDELKIDKSFVVAASQDPVALQIVHLLQSLTQEMQLLLVAEGVEDDTMFELLRQAGLKRYQGYLFSRPLSRAALVAAGRSSTAPRLGASPA